MTYQFLNNSIDINDVVLPNSDKIHPLLLKNDDADIKKALAFLATDEKFLYVHGFLGTGKRQFINYVADFLQKDVIKLEYYCKESTVCDDILLYFIDIIEKTALSKAVNLNTKVTTLAVKFQTYISSIKKPFIIILHSFDYISQDNSNLVSQNLQEALTKNSNLKVILSTRALVQGILGNIKFDKKIFLKAFSKDIFKEFLTTSQINCTDTTLDDFYKYTRGYYYYTALSIKIIQAMKISLNDFLEKFAMSGMNFDSYLGITYINLIPNTIRNFFWFLRTVRHGLTFNALAVFELYDEFSIEYLKTNLMIFQVGEIIYVQDYFQQNIDISIPAKTEIKLHKYIISIYEKQLKEPLQTREILISRQALRAEIDFHNNCIKNIEVGSKNEEKQIKTTIQKPIEEKTVIAEGLESKLQTARKLHEEKKNTEAIELYSKILEDEKIDVQTKNEVRLALAKVYKEIGSYSKAVYYLERIETYYKKNNEVINLNYLYYELTDIYFLMYKCERAIKTIKKVIYSVDTPQSLMVASCTLLGNIYTSQNNPNEAYSYYKKALESLDENTSEETLSELYFKYALASDDRGDEKTAFEYYTKCITLNEDNPYKSLAYSNMGACYFDNNNLADAKDCLKKAYDIEKRNNDYDGIYYNASQLAEVLVAMHDKNALNYLIEAKQSAEFLDEGYYIMESCVALGDYYYNDSSLAKKALKEYFEAKRIAVAIGDDVEKIDNRIKDMKLRMSKEEFSEIENKYEEK